MNRKGISFDKREREIERTTKVIALLELKDQRQARRCNVFKKITKYSNLYE